MTNKVQARYFQQSVNLVVGGIYYSLRVEDFARFPDSYFAHFLQPHWTKDSTAVLKIDRNGEVFRYISSYIFSGQWEPLDRPIYDLEMLLSVREEADFYNFPDLVERCDASIIITLKEWSRKQLLYVYVDDLSMCDCVLDTCAGPTDPLVNAIHLIRPPCIATAVTTNLDKAAKSIRTWDRSLYASTPGSVHNNCIESYGDSISYCQLMNICNEFAVCPFTSNTLKPDLEDRCSHTEMLVSFRTYIEGGYSVRDSPDCRSDTRIGTIVCILHSEYTGGRITAQVDGKTVSIQQPGECMALHVGCSYAVETVTSGTLNIVEFDMEPRQKKEPAELTLKWIFHQPIAPNCENEVRYAILNALELELERYEGVVVCLTSFYPIVNSFDATRQFRTADNVLAESDAELQLLLQQHYDVDLVTVVITVLIDHTTVVGARVLDYFIIAETTEFADNEFAGALVDTMHKEEIPTSAKYKIVAPLYGYGEKFTYDRSSKAPSRKGMLLTALMITRKE